MTSFQCFLEKGFDTTSLNDLVKVSGLSKGAFYHYFNTKEDILQATMESFFIRYFRELPENHEELSLEESLSEVWLPYAEMFEDLLDITPDMLNYYRYLFTGLRYFPNLQEQVQNIMQATHIYVDAVLNKAQTEGSIRQNINTTTTADQLIRLIEGTGLLIGLQKQSDIRQAFTNNINGFLDNLKH